MTRPARGRYTKVAKLSDTVSEPYAEIRLCRYKVLLSMQVLRTLLILTSSDTLVYDIRLNPRSARGRYKGPYALS